MTPPSGCQQTTFCCPCGALHRDKKFELFHTKVVLNLVEKYLKEISHQDCKCDCYNCQAELHRLCDKQKLGLISNE